ncbi:MAG TPA: hypothetical protein VLZ73_00595 [Brevundimonas sp.]|nr:hypothetical protein [Brevundimonas sp.]
MFRRPSRRRHAAEEARIDIDRSSPPSAATDDLHPLLDEIESAALAVYALHGLPHAPGHYRQAPGTDAWEHLGHSLSPADKWTLLNQRPADQGWRYASLEQIGGRSPLGAVRHASGLLAACQGLRQRLNENTPLSAQDVADAIRLGAVWRRLLDASQPRSHLQFLAPDED